MIPSDKPVNSIGILSLFFTPVTRYYGFQGEYFLLKTSSVNDFIIWFAICLGEDLRGNG